MSEFNKARREGIVKFGYDFNSLAEVTHLFGKSSMSLPYQVSFPVPGCEDTICLLLSENGGNGWKNIPHRGFKMDSRGHRQIVRIDEVNADKDVSAARCLQELQDPLTRYLFWREQYNGKAWYKFHGVLKIDVEATEASLRAGENACVYVKVADECPCPIADWRLAEISDADFAGYAGRAVEAVLADEIDFRIVEKDGATGSVKVWPGQKLFVDKVSPNGATVTCHTEDVNLLADKKQDENAAVEFTIPRRDFELGYFRVGNMS